MVIDLADHDIHYTPGNHASVNFDERVERKYLMDELDLLDDCDL
jgi:hypothetical protein